MGILVTRGARSSGRGQVGPRGRLVDSYNRSSLAMDLDEDSAAMAWKPMPHLVPRPAVISGPAPRMFRGLDPAYFQKDKKSNVLSFCIHAAVIAGVLWWGVSVHPVIHDPQMAVPIKFVLTDPVMQVAKTEGGGGGGGVQAPVVKQVKLPPRPQPVAPRVKLLPPEIARIEKPKLAAAPTQQVNMQLNSSLPQMAMQDSPQVALKTQGSGAHAGFGTGMGGGIGIGQSSGPGTGGGYGGGVMSVGGGVSAPILVRSVDPEFTEQARRANLQGTVAIELIVDSQGNPQDIRVVRHLGMGLDQKAMEAVRQYHFQPAMYQGHPVSVQMIVDVDFQLH